MRQAILALSLVGGIGGSFYAIAYGLVVNAKEGGVMLLCAVPLLVIAMWSAR